MNTPLSIIVPIYNAEKYLQRCIDSILSQSFSNFELILVDDGSTDASGKISEDYASIDQRIRVIHKENGGVSSARNMGLDNAEGEWIYFVDADDEIEEGGLKILMDCSKNVDIVLCGYRKFNNNSECIFSLDKANTEFPISKEHCLFATFDYPFHNYYYLGWMCVWMFKRKNILDWDIRFSTEIQIKEDTLFIVQYICRCVDVGYFNSKSIYKYYETETSIMHSTKQHFEPKYLTSFDACVQIKNEILGLHNFSNKLKFLSYHTIWDRYYLIRSKMIQFGQIDKNTLHSLFSQSMEETGWIYTLKYQIERNKRRIINYIKRHINQ